MNRIRIPVSIGELVDKITILQIKEEMIADPDKLVNVSAEREALVGVCEENGIDLDHALVSELREINRRLWKIEDDIREKERAGEFDEEFVEQARSVYRTNDLRFEAKSKINDEFGSELREEKSYEPYD